MEIEEQLEKAHEIEKLLWKTIESYLESDKDIILTSAVLIRIALSLYTVILPDDKDVEKIAIQGITAQKRSFGGISAYKVTMEGMDAALIIPNRTSHTPEIIEIIAHLNLRKKFTLKDGDEVNIS